jgi:nanoRNase/pAp phosphatase (c-di-AMP/oligoRNAs hydrolase)
VGELARARYRAFADYVAKTPRRGRWLVLMHDNPDPDALAAAWMLGTLLREQFDRRATIAYGGLIGRAENRAMVSTLRVPLARVRQLDFSRFDHFALVDAQPRTGNHQLPPRLVPDVVIDHHPPRTASLRSPIADLRTHYGATATILGEYLLQSELPISARLATALVYAVRSETLDWSRESPGPDRAIYDLFFPLADKARLGKIQRPALPWSYFRTLRRALSNLERASTLVVSYLAEVAQPDIVPETADLLLRIEGCTWSFCTGAHEDRIYCSLRATNPRADAALLMRRLLGRRGKGGGHDRLAGGWLPAPAGGAARLARAERQLARRLAALLFERPVRLRKVSFDED